MNNDITYFIAFKLEGETGLLEFHNEEDVTNFIWDIQDKEPIYGKLNMALAYEENSKLFME